MHKFTSLLFILFCLTSCGHKVVKLQSKSPDGSALLTVNGEQSMPLSAYKVVLRYIKGPMDGMMEFEIEASDLDDKTVSFDWKDDDHCIIRFQERDGKPRTFAFTASGTLVLFSEVKDN